MDLIGSLGNLLSRLNATIYKYYFLTLVFILILFKRRIPKWMTKNAREIIEPSIVLGKVEKYVK